MINETEEEEERRRQSVGRAILGEESGMGSKVWRACRVFVLFPGAEGQAPKFGDLTLVLLGGAAPVASKI